MLQLRAKILGNPEFRVDIPSNFASVRVLSSPACSPSRYSVFFTTFVQRRPNVFDVGPPLCKCYTKVLCLLGNMLSKLIIFCCGDITLLFNFKSKKQHLGLPLKIKLNVNLRRTITYHRHLMLCLLHLDGLLHQDDDLIHLLRELLVPHQQVRVILQLVVSWLSNH